MPTAEKERTIEQARDWYSKSSGVVFTDYRGLKVKELQALRADLRKRGGELHVLKNTLFRIAAGDHAQGLPTDLDNGTTAYAFVYENESDVAKALLDYARTSKKLVVKGGLFGGKAFTSKEVEALSSLPPKEVLISQVIGLIASPLSNLVGTVEALYADPIRVIAAVADKIEKEGPAAAASAPAVGSDDPQVHGYASSEAPATPPQTDVEGGHVVTPSDDPSETGAVTTDPTATVGLAVNEPTLEAREDVGGLPEAGTDAIGKGTPGSEGDSA
jgi:large subunit ribosomal protein L10